MIELPPAIYDYEPANYAVMYAPQEEMVLLCGWPTIACAYPAKRLIVVNASLTGCLLDLILRHEKAHLNGWTH